jgi:hypothetical protein
MSLLVKVPEIDDVSIHTELHSASADVVVLESTAIERESPELRLLGEISTIAVETRKALTNTRPDSCETPILAKISDDLYREFEARRLQRK